MRPTSGWPAALENENQLSAEAKANPVRFQGFTYDSASDLYDMQARHYRPEVGRFLTRDRYESSALDVNLEQDPLTNNMYAFAGGNPVNGVEWDGHCSNNAQVQWGLTNGVVVKCLTDQPGTNGGTAHGPATAPPAGYSAPPGVTMPFSAPKPAPGAPADMSSYASMNVQFARPLPGPGLADRAVSAGVWYFGSPAACARQFKGWTEEDSEPCGAAVLTVATLGSGAALRAGKVGLEQVAGKGGFSKLLGRLFGLRGAPAIDSAAKSGLSKEMQRLAEAHINDSGTTVLGSFPGYIEKAKARRASYFNIGSEWNKLEPAERTAANEHFLDKIAASRDRVLLSTSKSKIMLGTALDDEIIYLTREKGYRWVNQWSLRPR